MPENNNHVRSTGILGAAIEWKTSFTLHRTVLINQSSSFLPPFGYIIHGNGFINRTPESANLVRPNLLIIHNKYSALRDCDVLGVARHPPALMQTSERIAREKIKWIYESGYSATKNKRIEIRHARILSWMRFIERIEVFPPFSCCMAWMPPLWWEGRSASIHAMFWISHNAANLSSVLHKLEFDH